MIQISSRYDYRETIQRLSQAIASAGSTLFATIDQSAAAAGAGLSLRPTTLLIFGNPKAGTPLMAAFPLSALDLPLKLVVWEENGVHVACDMMEDVVRRRGLSGVDAPVAAIDRGLKALVATVS
ncbi:MAG: DUF302 domain-containing protein [Candidatus Eremiobacteraeota bacterium]|nr:DUF302 domain-containing protein [Candidatus Eremiobacteraeota bacterium]